MTPLRRTALALACVLALLLALDSAAWFWATRRMLAMTAEWEAARAADGVSVQSQPAVATGWPFAAEVLLPNVAVATDGGLLAWQAETVLLRLSPFHPQALAVVVGGKQSLRAGGLLVGVTANALQAAVPLDGSGSATGEGRSVVAATGAATLGIGLLAVRFDQGGLGLAASRLAISGIDLPFGGAIERFAAHLHLTAAIPPLRDPARAAAAWSAGGGAVVVDGATLRWGTMDAEGHGTAGLDPALQPVAAATLRLAGYAEAIEALARAGTISRNAGRVAGTVLGLMAATPAEGGPATVEAPFSLRDGRLSMGAIPLARVPALVWP